MNTPKNLQQDLAPYNYWEEAAFTYAALLANPLTNELAEPWEKLLKEIETIIKGQRDCWLEEIKAQAQCKQANYHLGVFTKNFHVAKLHELRAKHKQWGEKEARASSEFAFYFGALRPSALAQLAPESQISHMEIWPQRILREESTEMQEHGPKLQAFLEAGKQALKARTDARVKTTEHRTDEIEALVKKINQQRLATYAELIKIGQKNEEVKHWPDAFFAKTTKPERTNREEARGKIHAILTVLAARKIEVSEEERQKISSTTDREILDKWLAAIAFVSQTAQLFSE